MDFQAERSLTEAVEMMLSGNPDGAFNAGNDLLSLPNEKAAEVFFCVAIAHGVKDARYNLALLLLDTNREDDARQLLELAAVDGDEKSAFTLAEILAEAGDYASAVRYYEIARAVPQTPVRLARALDALGETERASELFKLMADSDGEAAVEWTQRGNMPTAQAIALLERHLKSGDSSVLIRLANLYETTGNLHAAELSLRRSLGLGEPHAVFNLGLLLLSQDPRSIEGRKLVQDARASGDHLAAEWLATHE